MKERPILFNAPMVRAILDGQKTQTRRVVKSHKVFADWNVKGPDDAYYATTDDAGQGFFLVAGDHGYAGPVPCPFGQPGDRLWVRETWSSARGAAGLTPREIVDQRWPIWYRADGAQRFLGASEGGPAFMEREQRWRPSIHIPREACRITLEVTGVRVERLLEISESDAQAEGIDLGGFRSGFDGIAGREHTIEFHSLWESINGPGSWDANPWVWVVEFRGLP